MKVLKLVFKNSLRHKLRTTLTILGIAIAIMLFGFMRTIITAWNAGVEASVANRMITHHSVSIIFSLPLSYKEQITKIPGVSGISFANWFGGTYKDQNNPDNFFPRMAIDQESFFDLYPEFIVPPDQLEAFKRERNSCIVGEKIAKKQGFKIGDMIEVQGDIYPGNWDFVIRGIYKGKDASTDETQMFFQWKYLDEQVRASQPGREGQVGWYIIRVANQSAIPTVTKTIDDMYQNSRASTKTETEKEFAQSFVSMSSAIITSITVLSFVIVGIILLVLANTVIMAVRERTREYAVLKTLGFSAVHIVGLVTGESLFISAIGGTIGLILIFPLAHALAVTFPTWFPIVIVEPMTIILAVSAAIFSGVVAAIFPLLRILRMKIIDGLRTIG